jgi:hypothetical protein
VCCSTACTGQTCQTCGTLSSGGTGNCGYVNSPTADPRNQCTQGTTSGDGCRSNNCNGTGYACGIQSTGDGGCPKCQKCANLDIACENYDAGANDDIEPNTCGWCYEGHGGVSVVIDCADSTACASICSGKGYYGCFDKGCKCENSTLSADCGNWDTCNYRCDNEYDWCNEAWCTCLE